MTWQRLFQNPGVRMGSNSRYREELDLDGTRNAHFYLRDYLSPGGRYPYDDLARDMESAYRSGANVYLYSVPGFLMVSGYHTDRSKRRAKPWCLDAAYGRMKCFRTAREAIRGGR